MPKHWDLKLRTMAFALAVSELCEHFPRNYKGHHVGGQLFRAATAVAANYRAACRAKSQADFVAKIGTVVEESDETDFWLEFAVASGLLQAGSEESLRLEANELTAIFTRSQMTAREKLRR